MKTALRILIALVLFLPGAFCKTDAFTDLDTALAAAQAEQKALFIMFGRPACGNCQSLHEMIEKKEVRLPKTAFVVVDLNCDDPAVSKAFRDRYSVSGNTLPFVVIAKPDGTQIASRTGYGTSDQWNDFIRDARKDIK